MKRVFLRFLSVGATAFVVALVAHAQTEPTAEGLWEQVDDVSGKPEGWFRIAEKNGVYEGVLVKGFPKPGEDPTTWLCTKCEGPEKNAPVIGLTLIKGMKRNGLAYESGTIMDPRDGAVYRALMKLSPDGQKLEVRGYLGIALLGRSQMWNRLPDNALDPPPANRRDQKAPPRRNSAPARPAPAPAQR